MKSEITDLYALLAGCSNVSKARGVLDNLINIPIYREIMPNPSGFKVGKTLLTTNTRIRNVRSTHFLH